MSPKLLVPFDYLVVPVLYILVQYFSVRAHEFTINVSNCSGVLSDNWSLKPDCIITSSHEFHIQCTGSRAIKVWIVNYVETQIRCTHKNYMTVNALFQNGSPRPYTRSMRDSYIHHERCAENMSDPSTFTHVVKMNPKDGNIVRYSIRGSNEDQENVISVMVLYQWENFTTAWMDNLIPETIFEAGQEVILIPCIDRGPEAIVPTTLRIVQGPKNNETLQPMPVNITKIRYDPSNGLYINTTEFTDYNNHLYRCMEEQESVTNHGFDFRIVDLPDLKVEPVKRGNEVIRLFATKIMNVVPVYIQCNHKDPVRLEGTLTTNKVDHPKWLLDFYTAGGPFDWISSSKKIDISNNVVYETTNLPKPRHIANYRTGLMVFDELAVNCISESSGQVLYNWVFIVHDGASGDTLTGNKYLHLITPTHRNISESILSYEYLCYSETYDDVRLRSIRCSNPNQCALLAACFHEDYRCGPVVTEGSPCPKSQLLPTSSPSCQQSKALLPGQLTLCTAGGSEFSQIHFVGLDSKIYNYYEGYAIEASAIIQIEKPEYKHFYTKGTFIFNCTVHQFFSEGQIYWAILYSNMSQYDVKKVQGISRQDATDLVPYSQSNEILVESSDIVGIVCCAPDISSNHWFRSTLRIEVQESIHPKILTEQTEWCFDKDTEYQVIDCQADGFPLPTIEWFRFGEKIVNHDRLIDGPNNTKILRFEKPTADIQGVYECTAFNVAGNVTKEFAVSVRKYTKFQVAVIICVITALVVMSFPLLFLYRRYRLAKKPQIKMDETELDEFVNGLPEDQRNSEDPTQLPFKKEYKIVKENIEYIDKTRRLGGGRFGDVFLGKLKGVDTPFAFKMTKPNCPDEMFEALRLELKLMAFLETHVNIVTLIGAYISEIQMGVLYIVMEFCEHGSLEAFIKRKLNYYGMAQPEPQPNGSRYEHVHVLQGQQAFDFQDLLLWSEQIATGMEFLSKQKIVHLDLAARNVLLSSDRTAKICDFSLSRRLNEKIIYVKTGNEPVPWQLMAIECLLADTYSTESDVWAYGILLWEIFTLGEVPYPGVRWTNKFEFGNQLRMGLRNLKAEHATDEIDEMMRRCWVEEPQNRPGFSELKLFFSKLRNYIRVE